MNTITYKDAERVLDELAAEQPDYVYTEEHSECHYTEPDGRVGCIIGHVLERLGLPRPAWGDELNGQDVTALPLDLEEDTQNLLLDAQRQQDMGYSWGKAVETAKKWTS